MHDMYELVGIQKFTDGYCIAAITQHADFYRGDFAILRQHFQLFPQLRARCVVYRFYSLCVLHRQRSDRRHSIAAIRGERLQVGCDSCAAARIKSCYRQQYGGRWVSVGAHFSATSSLTTKIAGRAGITDRQFRIYSRIFSSARSICGAKRALQLSVYQHRSERESYKTLMGTTRVPAWLRRRDPRRESSRPRAVERGACALFPPSRGTHAP